MATPSTSDEEKRPKHKGLLREENIILGHLFGYSDAFEDSSSKPTCSMCANLPQSSIKDVLLMAIDIDCFPGLEKMAPDQQFHIGVSLLDTRSLQAPGGASQAEDQLDGMIKSVQFTIGNSKYCRKAANKFLFGQSEPILISEVKPRLEEMASGRDVILILHGARGDLKMLDSLGIDLHPVAVVDTVKAAQHPLELSYRYSLEKLLVTFDIPFTNLHAAGNDAHFALRALLMIVTKEVERRSEDARVASLSETLKSVALAPRPPSSSELMAPYLEAQRKAKEESRQRRKAKRKAKLVRNALRRAEREKAQGHDEADLESPPSWTANGL